MCAEGRTVCMGAKPTMAAMCRRSMLRREEATTIGQLGMGHRGLVMWALQGALGSPGKG